MRVGFCAMVLGEQLCLHLFAFACCCGACLTVNLAKQANLDHATNADNVFSLEENVVAEMQYLSAELTRLVDEEAGEVNDNIHRIQDLVKGSISLSTSSVNQEEPFKTSPRWISLIRI